jgi:uncharacterized protein with GYD domain
MPQYIALVNWTEKGISQVTDSPARAAAFTKLATEMGCTVHGLFFIMGRYDIATRIEAPNDETMSALTLKLGQLGNVRTETMRAFTQDEFDKIINMVTS